MFQLHVGCPPFRGASDYLIFQLSTGPKPQFSPSLDSIDAGILPEAAKDLISKMVQLKPADRLTLEDVI